jgi:hypothetical protein
VDEGSDFIAAIPMGVAAPVLGSGLDVLLPWLGSRIEAIALHQAEEGIDLGTLSKVLGRLVLTIGQIFVFPFEFDFGGDTWVGEAEIELDGDLISHLELLSREIKP